MSTERLGRNQIEVFLNAFDQQLRARLRQAVRGQGKSISQQVIDIRKDAVESKDKTKAHLKQPEAAFLNTWVAYSINEALILGGSTTKRARELLLAESYKALADISWGPAARPVEYPLGKQMGTTARAVYDRWVTGTKKKGRPFQQPYPDLAVGAPYGIVFEGKYFRSGSQDYAERQLVAAIHEALFYLGIPEIEGHVRTWSYRYACLVAFDASIDGALLAAWNRLKDVRQKFWDCANLKVIVISERELAA